jgi:iron(III) transport system substrate-binding protein
MRIGLLLGILATSAAITSTPFAQDIPAGYPPDYDDLIASAVQEGKLVIYSNMGEDNWLPVIEAFNKRYPQISVETLDIGPGEVFTRYRAEAGADVETADMLVAGSIIDFMQASGDKILADYDSPEKSNMPHWSFPLPGVTTFSTDPMVTICNKFLVPEELQADTMAGFFENISQHPDVFTRKFATYDGRAAFGESINFAFVRYHGDKAWNWLETAGSLAFPYGGGAGGMIEQTVNGELAASYFLSGPTLFPRLRSQGLDGVLAWHFPKDGTPIFMRGMGITTEAPHPAAARLMVDFLLSPEGQLAISEGGLTPYRPGVAPEGDHWSLDEILAEIGGEENMILINYDPEMLAQHDAFIARWGKLFGY